jgi:hypothetical protein
MSNIAPDAPTAERLKTQFLDALKQGDTRALLDTPAFTKKRHTIAQVLADEANGDHSELVIGCLLRPLARALHSADTTERMQAQADAAVLALLFANTHTEAADLADADADDELRGDYSEAFDRAAAFAGVCFPTVHRGAA